jgi:hypothetical protein
VIRENWVDIEDLTTQIQTELDRVEHFIKNSHLD